MMCDGCPNLVITPYAPWCNYDGTRKPLLYVRECPKEKNQQSRKAEGDRMNAREVMQALIDGKTLERDSPWYLIKLDDKGNLVACDTKKLLKKGEFRAVHTLINDMDRIYEEYPLTFEQALREMLDGKVVKCETLINSRRFHDGEFQFMNSRGEWIQVNWFENELQKGKWKVVE